jgi:hypothetical protein
VVLVSALLIGVGRRILVVGLIARLILALPILALLMLGLVVTGVVTRLAGRLTLIRRDVGRAEGVAAVCH